MLTAMIAAIITVMWFVGKYSLDVAALSEINISHGISLLMTISYAIGGVIIVGLVIKDLFRDEGVDLFWGFVTFLIALAWRGILFLGTLVVFMAPTFEWAVLGTTIWLVGMFIDRVMTVYVFEDSIWEFRTGEPKY